MAEQKMDPNWMDLNVMSSADMLAQMSDYIDCLLTFPNEQTLNIMYWHINSHSDPITSKIDFYNKLNSGEIQIKDNPDGAKKRDLDPDKYKNVNFRAQLPDGMNVASESGDIYGPVSYSNGSVTANSTTTTRTWQSQTDDDVHANGEWVVETKTKSENKTVTELLDIQDTGPTLNSTFGMEDMTACFKMWWMEKFNTAHEVVKRELRELLGDDNEYFVNFSESVGQLKNVKDAWDASTLPIWDLNVEAYGDQYSTPSIIPGVGAYNTKLSSKVLSTQLSKQTNTIFRSNLIELMDDPSRDAIVPGPIASFSTTSHGVNLVSDFMHPSRLTGAIGDIQEAIEIHLKGLYKVLEYISNKSNVMTQTKHRQILMNVEGNTTAVDTLKNKISDYTKDTDEMTHSRYGKNTKYNNNKSNATKLGASEFSDFFS